MRDGDAEMLELYKLSVEMADRVSARRGTANTFFLTLETLLAGFVGMVRPSSVPAAGVFQVDTFGIVTVCVVGLVLSATWWLLLRSYRDLNNAKFKVILAMETSFVVQPFGDEWGYLKNDPEPLRDRYAELGVVERVIPLVFAILYVVVGARAVFL